LNEFPLGRISHLAWAAGDRAALDRLTPRVYDESRRTSRKYMHRERDGHTLQATALVNDLILQFALLRQGDTGLILQPSYGTIPFSAFN
jgi:hypothetical protein